MYDYNYAKCYDEIHAQKDYPGEVSFITDLFLEFCNLELNSVLDVGCGTGNHAVLLSDRYDVVGVDLSEDMIAMAREKESEAKFYCCDVSEIEESGFELAISMFNVVNHIKHIQRLYLFFQGISSKLVSGGIFVFECWNGVAAIRDVPKDVVNSVGTLKKEIRVENDLMNLEVKFENCVSWSGKGFTNNFSHFLWPVKVYKDLLELCGVSVCQICPIFDSTRDATESDWKVVMVCRKQ